MIEKRKASRIPVSMRVDCEGIDPLVFLGGNAFPLANEKRRFHLLSPCDQNNIKLLCLIH